VGGHWASFRAWPRWPPATASRPTTCRSESSRTSTATPQRTVAGTLSKVGLGTFVDPRLGGGRLNAATLDDLVRVMEIDGEEWLFYKAPPSTSR
jgi:hypothetical protein